MKRPAGGDGGHGDVRSWRDKHGLTLTLDGTTPRYDEEVGPPATYGDDRLALSLDDSAPVTVSVVDGACQQLYNKTRQYVTTNSQLEEASSHKSAKTHAGSVFATCDLDL